VPGLLGLDARVLAAGAVLGDLEQVDLIGGERRLEGGDQLGRELRGGAGVGGRAGDALERGGGESFALS
jgi:hypothetical protein